MHVTKLVEFIARIPEHLDLQFSDFSTNFYTFLKFTVFLFLSSCNIYGLDPRIKFFSYKYAPGRGYSHGIQAIRQGPSPAAKEKWGKTFEARWRTSGWLGLDQWGSEEVAPWRSRGGGEACPSSASSAAEKLVQVRQARPARLGLTASPEFEEGETGSG